ncbi:family 1 encapsulin nanocompartment shell protein [Mumia zhuanghuii]|uniref:Type 1 encapsulin shell protein n=1 Tax=Mumia zhuanghuii TaxID=2585211 RepID=A0A5C4MNZ0_9ACTN|nr:family 1 encapsulin nanocompartment shell protein [Mumia zhuanghuii]TNC47542.1 bacteriocin [Mumia zhuanghuii]TNC50284.1 bacteriocin [Mumia zhuanghuii]
MNNLHRSLAPISAAAWAQIEQEASRTFRRNLAGRRVVDVHDPQGVALAGLSTGHRSVAGTDPNGVEVRRREVAPVAELRVTCDLSREDIDDVERGSNDSDWQPVKDAARALAFAEDGAVFHGLAGVGVRGIAESSSNPRLPLPADAVDYPDVVARALSQLRLAGVEGPYALLLSADAYTLVNETTDHGYPIHEQLSRLLDGHIVWAPAITGAVLLSTRGGDYDLHLGQDTSIGYLHHDDETVTLYLQESFAFLPATDEASVVLDG